MNKQVFRAFIIILAFVILSTPVYAIEFQPIGFEPLSMGGAGVASARGSFAAYYNPALLAEYKHGSQVSLSAGLGLREINIAEHLDNLTEIDPNGISGVFEDLEGVAFTLPILTSLFTDGNAQLNLNQAVIDDISIIKREVRAIAGLNGVQLMPSISLDVQVSNFCLGVYSISEATAYAVIDPDRLDIILWNPNSPHPTIDYVEYNEETDNLISSDQTQYEQRSFQYALENGYTYLKLTGLAYTEISLSHAHKFNLKQGELNLGAAFKIMPGYTFDEEIKLDTESGDIDNKLEDSEKSDTSWGIDLGVLYMPQKIENLSLGLVLKNINTPSFKTSGGNKLKVKPQIRTGIKYDFWSDRVTLALDLDLTNNKTFVPGYESQFIGGGLNFHPYSWLCLRVGAMSNMKSSQEGTILTAGIGFGLKWFQLDFSGQMSTDKTEFDREEIPKYMRLQASLVSKWF